MTIPTANPVPSNSPLDLLFNAEKLDEVVNAVAPQYVDRFGMARLTAQGATDTIKAINPRGAWVTATVYASKDVVQVSGTWYIAVVAHTAAATFPADSAKWRVYQGVTVGDLANPNAISLIAGSGQVVHSIAALRSLSKTSPSKDAFATGYYSSGDGGGGAYYYDAADTTTADNGGSVIVAADGARWKLIVSLSISVKQFGAKGDNATDDTAAFQATANFARNKIIKMCVPSAVYKISGTVDVSGLNIEGDLQGYLNKQGAVISCTANTVIPFRQVSTSVALATVFIRNIYITGAAVGIQLQYTLNSVIENVFVENSLAGFELGNSGAAGPLFVSMRNCQTSNITNIGLKINGNGFANANLFESCFFQGNTYGASVDCSGGLGAINNTFINCEFIGNIYGVALGITKNTIFDGCYFESTGPSVLINNFSLGVYLNNCVYGSLTNNNPAATPFFIYHSTTASASVYIRGGYIYIPAGAVYNSLTFIYSSNPATLNVSVLESPSLEIAATGFILLSPTLLSTKINYNSVGSYVPAWTATTNPAIGNGALTASYARSGNQVTVQIRLAPGTTTTFGTGTWAFSLPFPVASFAAVGTIYCRKLGVGYNQLIALGAASSISGYVNGSSNTLSATAPFTWANGDEMQLSVTYQC